MPNNIFDNILAAPMVQMASQAYQGLVRPSLGGWANSQGSLDGANYQLGENPAEGLMSRLDDSARKRLLAPSQSSFDEGSFLTRVQIAQNILGKSSAKDMVHPNGTMSSPAEREAQSFGQASIFEWILSQTTGISAAKGKIGELSKGMNFLTTLPKGPGREGAVRNNRYKAAILNTASDIIGNGEPGSDSYEKRFKYMGGLRPEEFVDSVGHMFNNGYFKDLESDKRFMTPGGQMTRWGEKQIKDRMAGSTKFIHMLGRITGGEDVGSVLSAGKQLGLDPTKDGGALADIWADATAKNIPYDNVVNMISNASTIARDANLPVGAVARNMMEANGGLENYIPKGLDVDPSMAHAGYSNDLVEMAPEINARKHIYAAMLRESGGDPTAATNMLAGIDDYMRKDKSTGEERINRMYGLAKQMGTYINPEHAKALYVRNPEFLQKAETWLSDSNSINKLMGSRMSATYDDAFDAMVKKHGVATSDRDLSSMMDYAKQNFDDKQLMEFMDDAKKLAPTHAVLRNISDAGKYRKRMIREMDRTDMRKPGSGSHKILRDIREGVYDKGNFFKHLSRGMHNVSDVNLDSFSKRIGLNTGQAAAEIGPEKGVIDNMSDKISDSLGGNL